MQNLKRICLYVALALLAYMPFHIFLSQWLSVYTGGLEVWKVWKDVVLLAVTLFTICLVWWQGKATRAYRWMVAASTLYCLLHLVLWAVHPDIYDRSALVGLMYNMRLPLSLVLGVSLAALLPKFAFSSVMKIALCASTIVAFLGVVQYFLPGDVMTHFGYAIDRGVRPAFYIDNNTDLPPRIISTLREPNALGAYLIVPATALWALMLRVSDRNKRLLLGGSFALHMLALFLTFSRSAWAAVALSLVLVTWWQYRSLFTAILRRFWPVAVGLVVIAAGGLYAIRDTSFFQSYVIHSNQSETVDDLDSNDYHALFIRQGLEGIAEDPLGYGPGTAGLASIQNPAGSFLTENYYIQIGYELGILGLVLFVAANVYVYMLLRRSGGVWAHVLMAAFWAYVVTNMLLHTWSNEAVALQWWLLAGLLISSQLVGRPKTQ